MSQSKKLIPRRRFREFGGAGEWQTNKLSAMAEFSKGNGYSKNDLREYGIPIILYGRLYTKYETIIKSVDTFVEKRTNSAVFSTGVEVVVPASGETSEDIARASFIEQSDLIIGGDLNILKPRTRINSVFLALSLSNGNQRKELIKRAQGKTVVHIHNSDLKEVNLNFPIKSEQTKIGEFFKKLDNLINTQQKKLEKAKTLKSAYLREMFPNEGELKPRLRFTGFNISWKEKKLEEITKTTIGEFVIKTKQNPNSPYPVYNGGISYTGFYDEFNNEANKIVISARGANAGFINIVRNRYWAGNSCYSINIINNTLLSIDYLFYSLKRNQHFFTQNQQAANIPSVSKKEVETFTVLLTNITEQTKIGNFFKLLDDKIALEQKKLAKLKNIKQAYLNEMFI
ncbi:restriction endonuclease subunit S [Snodgrassella communis]|uniref:restriction endonuclease subunit S n=1 Tax=Snodgrassella communis TaxID=2946699 RepID=UPI001EF70CB8|nr:restriction endonuclease subunit S [Snodgrassella communis]